MTKTLRSPRRRRQLAAALPGGPRPLRNCPTIHPKRSRKKWLDTYMNLSRLCLYSTQWTLSRRLTTPLIRESPRKQLTIDPITLPNVKKSLPLSSHPIYIRKIMSTSLNGGGNPLYSDSPTPLSAPLTRTRNYEHKSNNERRTDSARSTDREERGHAHSASRPFEMPTGLQRRMEGGIGLEKHGRQAARGRRREAE